MNVYQVLVSDNPFTSLESFIKPLETVDASTPITDVMDRMQRDKLKILLVTSASIHKSNYPIGIVTMKDLAEELLGELAVW